MSFYVNNPLQSGIQQSQWSYTTKATVRPQDALDAWREGLLTEDEARAFFGLCSKDKPCEKCKK